MDRDELIKQTKQLFAFHKQATAFDSEYTTEIYDFLVDECRINLTAEQKVSIFADAKRDYYAEMELLLKSDDKHVANMAIDLMKKCKYNELPEEEMKKLGQMCKVKSIKMFFDTIETINFKT